MLNRIVSIKNIGRFKNCAANGDVTFRHYTYMFGENARGKTTLCAILRSLITDDPTHIIGRTTLGNTEDPEVELLTSTGNIRFRNGTWSAAYPDIALFDATYIRENVYEGDAVNTEQRRSLYRVIIGTEGVDMAAQYKELEEQIRNKNGDIRNNQTELRNHIAPGMSLEQFIALPVDLEIDEKILLKEQELQAAVQADELRRKAELMELKVPVFPVSIEVLLGKTIENVVEDAELRVGEHIERHRMERRGESWINEGLGYVIDNSCPFCDQDITNIPLVRDFKSFFSLEYRALRDEVNQFIENTNTALEERVVSDIMQVITQNTASAESWQRYCEVPVPVLPESENIEVIVRTLREEACSLLAVKSGTPLEAVVLNESFNLALEAFENLCAVIRVYNEQVATANANISLRKSQALVADVNELERALANLQSQKLRHTDEVNELCTTAVGLQGEKATLERAKNTTREQLDTHTRQLINQYGERINWYLERINASFRITTPTYSYRGGLPSTTYGILINGIEVEIGDPQTPVNQPSFKNTLSAGDRTTLALAFFFAQLEQDANRANKIVVFDDPFGSMDSFRRSFTVHQIHRCGTYCAQIIVLSHDPNFLYSLWERTSSAERKTLCMERIDLHNTSINEWDVEQAVLNRYRADLNTLNQFMSSNEGNRRDVIQKIRPVLEWYYRTLYPRKFGAQETLGNIISKIRNECVTHPLAEYLEDLDVINNYCRRYHHAENQNATSEPVDDSELQGHVIRTLTVVGYLE